MELEGAISGVTLSTIMREAESWQHPKDVIAMEKEMAFCRDGNLWVALVSTDWCGRSWPWVMNLGFGEN